MKNARKELLSKERERLRRLEERRLQVVREMHARVEQVSNPKQEDERASWRRFQPREDT